MERLITYSFSSIKVPPQVLRGSHISRGPYTARMKSLILILCIAFAVNIEAAAGPTAEQLKTLATLLQEHHYRFTRQVATTPYTETTSPTTTPATPPDGSETPATAEPNTEFTTIFSRPECLRASERIVQSCVVAHGLGVDDLPGGNNSYDERLFLARQSEIFCRDSRCQEDFFRFYEICIGSEVRGRSILDHSPSCLYNYIAILSK